MAVTWDEQLCKRVYRASIPTVDYGAVWAPCSFSGGVATATAHGLAENQYVIFRAVTARTPIGDPVPMSTYRAANVTADTFEVVANAPGFPHMDIPDQTCDFATSRVGEGITYGREYYAIRASGGPFTERWSNIVRDFAPDPADTILVAGCAYGGLIEAAHDAGFPEVYGVESSAFMLGNDVRADVKIAQLDFAQLGVGSVRQQLKTVTGYTDFDWIIDEDMVTSFTDSEVVAGCNVANGRLNHGVDQLHVVHLVSLGPFTVGGLTAGVDAFNDHTLEQWKALYPSQSWVDIQLSSWRVL